MCVTIITVLTIKDYNSFNYIYIKTYLKETAQTKLNEELVSQLLYTYSNFLFLYEL